MPGRDERWPDLPLLPLPSSLPPPNPEDELDILSREPQKKTKHSKATRHHWNPGKENHSREMQLLRSRHQAGPSSIRMTAVKVLEGRVLEDSWPTHISTGPHAQDTLSREGSTSPQGGGALSKESDTGEAKGSKMERGQGKGKVGTVPHSDSREGVANNQQGPQPRKRLTADGPRESTMATRPETCPGPDHKT